MLCVCVCYFFLSSSSDTLALSSTCRSYFCPFRRLSFGNAIDINLYGLFSENLSTWILNGKIGEIMWRIKNEKKIWNEPTNTNQIYLVYIQCSHSHWTLNSHSHPYVASHQMATKKEHDTHTVKAFIFCMSHILMHISRFSLNKILTHFKFS